MEAMDLLLEAAGIGSIKVFSNTMDHAWNLVSLDGEMRYLDATFDDPVPDRGEYVSDQYFMLTAEELSETHVWDEAFYERLLDSMEKENS